MSKKHHGGPAPVPPGNRPHAGPAGTDFDNVGKPETGDAETGSPFQDQDIQRRLGGYEGAGEHAIQQPSALNDGNRRSK